jgi:hypothetical protein
MEDEISYEQVLRDLPEDDRKTFRKMLVEWKDKSPQIAENFEREHFLPKEEMRKLMEYIVSKGLPVGKKQIKKLEDELLHPNLQLMGDEIKVSPKRIGFAIPEQKYREALKKQYENQNNYILHLHLLVLK